MDTAIAVPARTGRGGISTAARQDSSPGLVAAMRMLDRYCLRQDAPTLDDMRSALQVAALGWSGRGELRVAPQSALVAELDQLIGAHGGGAPAAAFLA